MFLLEVANLSRKYGKKEVLKGIDLRVERGEVVALIGPTGAGKTTILRLLDLLDPPTAGKIYFAGEDVTHSPRLKLETRRRMALVFQKPVVFKASVHDNIAYALKVRGHNRRDISAKVSSMLNTVDLADYRNRNAQTLSGGEAQRVALARAMITQPEMLLLDEPTANLDPLSTSMIENLIQRFNREYATTIIMATHDMAQGQRLAHRIAVLMNGELMQIGKPGEIFSRPRNMKVAEFVGVENIIKGTISSNDGGVVTVDVDGNTIEGISDYRAGEEVSVCVRPEDITLALSRTSSSARNSFPARIKLIASSGPLVRVELGCGFPLVVLLTRRSAEEMGLQIGKDVYASFKATAAHIIGEAGV
ncbi:ABC transporter ATP-binding protein [Dehalococcoidia bacterium]|nr:ABC transporter ATP-binding protein [Dehalococcoidia bacterium]MCL0073577.1 ABC transporter ATP-binding protein [Dehalococcoidia bacterium]